MATAKAPKAGANCYSTYNGAALAMRLISPLETVPCCDTQPEDTLSFPLALLHVLIQD
jgi:hypothetical protein